MNDLTTPPKPGDMLWDERADELTIVVPPAGLWKSGGGMLFLFCLVWWGLLTATEITPVHYLFFRPQFDGMAFSFTMLLWLIGFAMLVVGYRLGRKTTCLAVVGDHLSVLEVGVFQTLRRRWLRSQIKDVYAWFEKQPGPWTTPIVLGILGRADVRGHTAAFCRTLDAYPSLIGELCIVTFPIHERITLLEGTRAARLMQITVGLRRALGLR